MRNFIYFILFRALRLKHKICGVVNTAGEASASLWQLLLRARCCPGGASVHPAAWPQPGYASSWLTGGPWGGILKWRAAVRQLMHNTLCKSQPDTANFLQKSWGVFPNRSLKSNYALIMASQKMQTVCFNPLCQVAHFLSSCETFHLDQFNGRFFFPWVLRGEGTWGRIRQRAVQKQCAASLAFEVAPTKCWTREVSAVLLRCVSTSHGASAQEEILAWA